MTSTDPLAPRPRGLGKSHLAKLRSVGWLRSGPSGSRSQSSLMVIRSQCSFMLSEVGANISSASEMVHVGEQHCTFKTTVGGLEATAVPMVTFLGGLSVLLLSGCA
jgi:hypothetical protein